MNRNVLVLAIVCAGQFMVVLDVSVVNVALPSIQTNLGFEPAELPWVVNAYALMLAGFLLFGGRLGDLYGRKRIFILGLALFSMASGVGGAAGDPGLLIAARAVQGLGAAVLTPATLTIVTTTFSDPARRARALATWTAVGAAGGAAGNLVGGVLTQLLSWRWTLLLNVPIGVIVALPALSVLAESHHDAGRRRLDVPGVLLVTGALMTITYGITRTQTCGWACAGVLAPLAAGTAALAAFAVVETRFARAPLMPLRLLGGRATAIGNLMMLLVGATFMPMWYFLSLSMQKVMHYDPVGTGLAFVPHTLAIILGSRTAPRLMHSLGARRLITVAALVAACGFLAQARIGPHGGYAEAVLLPAVLMCGGLGLLMTPITAIVTAAAAEHDSGLVSGLLNTAQRIGGSFGIAALTALDGQTYSRAFLISALLIMPIGALAAGLRDHSADVAQATSGSASGRVTDETGARDR